METTPTAPSVNVGAEMEEILTERLGFSAIGADKKLAAPKRVKLLPDAWPEDNLPPSSACLLAVASKRGLVAAAGPDALYLASTDAVRKAFQAGVDKDGINSSFTPDVTIGTSQLRHIAFSSDEEYLVATREEGDDLIVYRVEDALNNRAPCLALSLDNLTVRALVPNPSPQMASLFAVVFDSGRLVVVDVAKGDGKPVQEENVTCVAWSTAGKALVAGRSDGTALQWHATQNKEIAVIPCPPNIPSGYAGRSLREGEGSEKGSLTFSSIRRVLAQQLRVLHCPLDHLHGLG